MNNDNIVKEDNIKEEVKKEEKKNDRKKYMIFLIILLLLIVSVGYSVVTSNILINGTTNIRRSEWDVHFDSVNVVTGSNLTVIPPRIDNTGTIINFTVNLDRADDVYELVADVYNAGTMDAKVTSYTKLGLTTEQEEYVSYNITYLDGSAINSGDMLRAGEKKKVKVTVKYLQLLPIDEDDLSNKYETVNLAFKINYVQN